MFPHSLARGAIAAAAFGATAWLVSDADAAGQLNGPPAKIGSSLNAVAASPDGNAVVAGTSGSSMFVQRVSAAGAQGSAFSAGSGTARGVAVRADGKITVAGDDNGLAVRRFNADGTPDASFASGGVARAAGTANAVASTGCLPVTVTAGSVPATDALPLVSVSRFLDNGSADSSFGSGGTASPALGANAKALGVALQPDGKIVIVGNRSPGQQVTEGFVARLTATGALDSTFGTNGVVVYAHPKGGAFSSLNAVVVAPSGDIVVGGTEIGTGGAYAVAGRVNAAGQPDTSFDGDGFQQISSSAGSPSPAETGIRGIAVAANGEIVGAGAYLDSGLRSQALYALTSSGAPDTGVAPGGRVVTAPDNDGAESNAAAVLTDGTVVTGGQTRNFFSANSGLFSGYAGFGPVAFPASGCAPPTPPAQPSPQTTPQVSTTPQVPATPKPQTPATSAARLSKVSFSKASVTPKKSTKLSFTLTRAANVSVTLEQKLKGRKKGSKCTKSSASNRKGKSCTYYAKVSGKKSISGKSGSNSVTFTSKLGSKRLKTGSYRVTVAASGGNQVTLSLTVRKK